MANYLDATLHFGGDAYRFFAGYSTGVVTISDGEPHEDTIYIEPTPLSKFQELASRKVDFTRVDAVIPVTDVDDQFWAFSGYQFTYISARGTGTLYAALPIDVCKCLKEAGFHHVDAFIPIPGHAHHFWVFSGRKWARVEFPDMHPDYSKLHGEVRDFEEWGELYSKTTWARIDAVLPVPDQQPHQFWVFHGNEWVRIILGDDPNDPSRTKVRNGPSSVEKGWKTLASF
ncbi:hypothetical protein [Streptomyces sp. NPDC088554]|uniref:hypothetical protein n=1 Tax=Streptomyces sp. NPDC088554 TaxID=3365865 RepID=UPI00380698DB